MMLTPQQCTFFESFGYLMLPGLMTDDIDWIIEEHGKVFEQQGVVHDGSKRSMIVPFSDQRERLCTLLDHPKVLGVLKSLLGEDFNYVGGDGNYYSGDTNWHSDGGHQAGLFAKYHLYLDPLTRDTGCIRVIPGSHLIGPWRKHLQQTRQPDELLGIPGRDVPCIAAETEPGDVVVFNHNIYHASFGGGPARRHMCLNVTSRAKTEAEVSELDRYLRPAGRPKHWLGKYAPGAQDIMRNTASPERYVHLEQVIQREQYYLNTTQ